MIENERKYVLRDPQVLYAKVREYWGKDAWLIRQGYLPGNARVRSQTLGDDLPICVFTYKFKTDEGLVEIEKMIDDKDFDRLWPYTTNRLVKRRFAHLRDCCFGGDDSVQWDVDFFLDDQGGFYFAMAECEMPAKRRRPKRIFPLIADYVAYEVPRERGEEFTNVRLADPAYAALVMSRIGDDTIRASSIEPLDPIYKPGALVWVYEGMGEVGWGHVVEAGPYSVVVEFEHDGRKWRQSVTRGDMRGLATQEAIDEYVRKRTGITKP